MILRCGKHAGRQFSDVAATDVGYCAWLLREKNEGRRLARDLKAFANYIQDVHGGVLAVGRHSGQLFAVVLREDREYGEWAASLENPSKLMIGFHKYVKKRQRIRPRDTGDDTCSICLDRTLDSAFIPCGHQAACIDCARRLHANGYCLICRDPIADVLQTFFAGACSSGCES